VRRRLSWAVLGTLSALAAVVAIMMTGGADGLPNAQIIVPQAENTEIAMPRQSTVDIPVVPYAAATTEISTPETAGQPKQKHATTIPPAPPPSSAAPPPAQTISPTNTTPWWYSWYLNSGGGGGGRDGHNCRRCR
jgi:hypothetical protein